MIGTKNITGKANSKIASGLTEEQIVQLSVLNLSFEKSKLDVGGDILNTANNRGRLVYSSNSNEHIFSNGNEWLNDFSSSLYVSSVGYGWGNNGSGRLGDNGSTNRSSPVTVVGGITNWSQVSAGGGHSLGVTSTGIAYAWGFNSYGVLGVGDTSFRLSPVTVIGGITNWSSLSAGSSHSLGVTDTGIAYAWGLNSFGRLGDGTSTSRLSPVTVIGGITNWSQVSAGASHSLGVTDTGIAYAWGNNNSGRLGDGTTTARSSPVTVIGGITNWSLLSADGHSLGLTDTGIAYAWGSNSDGRLGDGTTTARSSPVTVVGGITNWSQLSAGSYHSLGVTDTGIAYAWGSNTSGRLGDGTTTARSSPVTVIGGIANWSQVSAGYAHNLGVTSTGVAYAWGNNGQGRLGDGTETSRLSPVTVIGGITNWSSLSAGSSHSLGLGFTSATGFR